MNVWFTWAQAWNRRHKNLEFRLGASLMMHYHEATKSAKPYHSVILDLHLGLFWVRILLVPGL